MITPADSTRGLTLAEVVKAWHTIKGGTPWLAFRGKVKLRVIPWLAEPGIYRVDIPEDHQFDGLGQVVVMDEVTRASVADVPDDELAAIITWLMATDQRTIGRRN